MRRMRHDDGGAVGIDLMITYIGIVIMMIVVGSTAMSMVERMSQQTQHTALDATKEAGTKMIVVGGWIEDGYDDYLFMIEYQSQGKNVLAEDVEWTLWCVENGNTLHYRSGTIDDWISGPPIGGGDLASIWEVGDDPSNTATELISGARYFFGIDGGTNTAPGGAQCGPNFINNNGISANLVINLPDGGTNTQVLEIGRYEVGAPVI
ncbi:MAG: hypothetical protein L7U48_04280 [Candidatus Poseidoniaceae archaeon]|nr:hypothetical protein [Candidatus Poseidoniaceae archaeon]